MYLIRAVTVHSNRPKEVWFGPSAYTARILWSGGKFFLIEGPQRPPPGLSGLHVVPPLPSPAANVGRHPFAQASSNSAAVRWSLCSLGQRSGR